MKKLLSFTFLLLLSSCGLSPLIKPNEFSVTIEVEYEYLNPLSKKIENEPDLGATIYIFRGVDRHSENLVFDGKGNLTGNNKTIKYSEVFSRDYKVLKFKKGYHTIGYISGNLKENGNYKIAASTINVDGIIDNAEAYQLFKR